MRRQRSDDNQPKLVQIARDMGASVLVLSMTKSIDLLIGCNGIDQLVEIKDGSKLPSERTLSDNEKDFHDEWKGRVPVIIEDVDGMVKLITWMRKRGHQMIAILILAAVLSFHDAQCQYFRDVIYDHLIAANAGDVAAQKMISDYELACVGTDSGWECIDDPMPGHVLKCRPLEAKDE